MGNGRSARTWPTPKFAAAFAYVTVIFMAAADTHIVNIMMPTLQREFGVALSSVQWTSIGYVLVLAVFIPVAGWFGDRFGTKRVYLGAISLFVTSSMLCGLAQNLPQLVVARVVQGVGGGLLLPVGTAMLFRTFPAHERARMNRLLILPILFGPIIAQPLGGLLVEKLSWRWAFFINLPIGTLALLVCSLGLLEHREESRKGFDLVGFLLGGVGLSLFLFGIGEGSSHGLTSPVLWGCGLSGAALLVVFVAVELRVERPMLHLDLFHDRIFRATNVVGLFSSAAFVGGLIFVSPLFVQQAKGESPLHTGLTTMFSAFGVMAASQTVGRLYPHVGPRRLAFGGNLGVGLALAAFVFVDGDTNLWTVRAILFCAGFANFGSMIALQTSMFATISSSQTGSGASIVTASRQAATATGIALATIVISLSSGDTVERFHAAYVTIAIVSFAGAIASALLIHDSDAASTMRGGERDAEPMQLAIE